MAPCLTFPLLIWTTPSQKTSEILRMGRTIVGCVRWYTDKHMSCDQWLVLLGFRGSFSEAFTCLGRIKFMAWRLRRSRIGMPMVPRILLVPGPYIKKGHMPYFVLVGRQTNTTPFLIVSSSTTIFFETLTTLVFIEFDPYCVPHKYNKQYHLKEQYYYL